MRRRLPLASSACCTKALSTANLSLLSVSLAIRMVLTASRLLATACSCVRLGWCLLKTTSACLHAWMVSRSSFSSKWKACASWVRMPVAESKAFWSCRSWLLVSARLTRSSSILAAYSPIAALRSAIRAFPASMAADFSLSFSSHQQLSCLYTCSSLAFSFSSCTFISSSMRTIFMTGLSLLSRTRALSTPLPARAAEAARRRP
mmetsp:Transcript_25727/g.59835  ORF Transcript_25727/g.59835 Transcript_25727/m.59835 type:complete len:204 (-) Transcript_25727:72-683(-)